MNDLTSFVGANGREYIPAVQWESQSVRLDPNIPDRQALTDPCVTLRHRPLNGAYERKSGELRFTSYDCRISKADFDRMYAYTREQFGKDAVKSIVVSLLIDDAVADTTPASARLGINLGSTDRRLELQYQLERQNYRRQLDRESGLYLVYKQVPPRQWQFDGLEPVKASVVARLEEEES